MQLKMQKENLSKLERFKKLNFVLVKTRILISLFLSLLLKKLDFITL